MQAALEWQTWHDNKCTGCGQPRDESFAPEHSFSYSAQAFDCHACAARERSAWLDNEGRDSGSPPVFGRYYAVTLDDD